ncbi:TPA: hypothetical protein EYG96_02125 [Candidatus Gracilibacteria bacterium]|nr:hypothetical protein [Candidatus Peregrinibacteria bacterium]HIQ56818.1 hypothetical protein [Candidatus Gracilibacteria bacterium]HIQ57759.1 hypothetical protein [Candidatus Gracilibacteria bacterium]
MRINKSIATVAGSALIVPLLASATSAADIQIWSNEKELENGNHLVLDADNTGGDIFLQFGNTLGESLSWDSANSRFNLTNSLNVEGNISLTGNIEMQALATVDGVDVSELGNATAALETQVNTNTTNIASNDTDILALQTEQSAQATRLTVNEGDIDDLEILTGNGNFTGANYLVFGSDLTAGLLKLDSQIKINADNLSINASNIASNDTDILALQTEQSSQAARLTVNESDIDALENSLSTPKAETFFLPLGSVVIKEDGSNNAVNVFRSVDDTGFGHHFHTVTSSQPSLQDLNLNFQIKTPADVEALTSLTVSYKTDGSVSDSKIDIKIVDGTGATIVSNTGLSSSAWTDVILDISGHTAVAGEILTVEVTGYTKSNNASYIGELVFDYTETK